MQVSVMQRKFRSPIYHGIFNETIVSSVCIFANSHKALSRMNGLSKYHLGRDRTDNNCIKNCLLMICDDSDEWLWSNQEF